MVIRLNKEAPWAEVEIEGVKINKIDWIPEDSVNYTPVKKWIIFGEQEPEVIAITATDYSVYTKKELVEMCDGLGLGLYTKKSTKAQLIDMLTSC